MIKSSFLIVTYGFSSEIISSTAVLIVTRKFFNSACFVTTSSPVPEIFKSYLAETRKAEIKLLATSGSLEVLNYFATSSLIFLFTSGSSDFDAMTARFSKNATFSSFVDGAVFYPS